MKNARPKTNIDIKEARDIATFFWGGDKDDRNISTILHQACDEIEQLRDEVNNFTVK